MYAHAIISWNIQIYNDAARKKDLAPLWKGALIFLTNRGTWFNNKDRIGGHKCAIFSWL